MAASAHEAVLARAAAVLLGAGTAAGTRIERGRPAAYSPSETPAINVRRSTGQAQAFGRGADQAQLEFELDHYVRGDDWETSADALHMAAHAALLADAALAALCKGLRCATTNARAEAGDQTLGQLTATYQCQALLEPGALTLFQTT